MSNQEKSQHDDNRNNDNRYDDIINFSYHGSKKHPHMDAINRAAQFAPFAALTGYGEAIDETGRLTDEKIDLDETGYDMLEQKLKIVMEDMSENQEITVTYFKPDERKKGGRYVTATGAIKKIDVNIGRVIFKDGRDIPIEDIRDIEKSTLGE
jgi:hypothetical protein